VICAKAGASVTRYFRERERERERPTKNSPGTFCGRRRRSSAGGEAVARNGTTRRRGAVGVAKDVAAPRSAMRAGRHRQAVRCSRSQLAQ
jgi:hypothetical protein